MGGLLRFPGDGSSRVVRDVVLGDSVCELRRAPNEVKDVEIPRAVGFHGARRGVCPDDAIDLTHPEKE